MSHNGMASINSNTTFQKQALFRLQERSAFLTKMTDLYGFSISRMIGRFLASFVQIWK
jgi:hypothetical protein